MASRTNAPAESAVDSGQESGLELGPRIRTSRLEHGLSLGELAGRAQVSKSLVSQIERGVATPSIETLRRIASALGVPVFSFFLDTEENGMVVRADQRRVVSYPGTQIRREVLSPNLTGRMVLLWVTFPAHEESGAAAVRHVGEESVVVIEGSLEVLTGEQAILLSRGDSMTFDAELPHRFRNPTGEPCQAIIAISPPQI